MAGDVVRGAVTSIEGAAGHGHAAISDGRMTGPLPLADAGMIGVDVSTSCDGIVIGPSSVGRPEVGDVVASGVLADVDGATAMLGAASAYGSIGRMSPDGPATSDRVERLGAGGAGGSIAAGALELDACGSAAGAVAGDRAARCGPTIQRPAA